MSKVSEKVISAFLKDIEETGKLHWQRPYEFHDAFNYFSMKPYRGINRLILPFGEYMTANQINTYNKQHNEDFRFQKGIKWHPVVFFTTQEKLVSREEMSNLFPDADLTPEGFEWKYVGTNEYKNYFKSTRGYMFSRNIMRYSDVADRKYFVNSKGETLPSRLETGEVEITLSDARDVVDSYLSREGIMVYYTNGVPCWNIEEDTIQMNNFCKNEDEWFSTMFHEMGHSTGHKSRLNREGCNPSKQRGLIKKELLDIYAKEECIAEICACLCCAECGIYDFKTSGTRAYMNNLAYVQSWKSRIMDWGKDFIYIVSQADKAYNMIMGYNEEGE